MLMINQGIDPQIYTPHPIVEKYNTINDDKNNKLAEEYRKLASKEDKVIFGGRLAEYKYYDMDDVIKSAFETYKNS